MKPLSLLYHRVNNLSVDPWTTCVSPAHFAEHLAVIASLSPRPVVTFDDGYADNLQYALPCLQHFEVSARIFLVSGSIGSEQEMWWDALDRLFLGGEPTFDIEDGELTSRQQQYREYFDRIRPLPFSRQQEILSALFTAHGLSGRARPQRRMLTAVEAEQLARSPLIEIGAHTQTHPVLSMLSPAEQEREIRGSKQALEELLHRRVHGFAYPNGMSSDYNETTVQLVKEAGFLYSYSAFPNDSSDPFQLGRIMVRDWDGEQFRKILAEAEARVHST